MFHKFVIFILFIPLLMIFYFNNDISNFENRKLISKNDVFNSLDNFFEYLNDYFPYRNSIIKFYGFINYNLGYSIHPNLFIGKNGYLFLSNIDNITLKQRGIFELSQDEIDYIKNNLVRIFKWAKSNNINLYFIPAPNQQTIHSEYLPLWHTSLSNQDRYYIYKDIFDDIGWQNNFISLKETLQKFNDEHHPTYYKLEGHWTKYGQFISLKYILNHLGVIDRNIYDFKATKITWSEHFIDENVTEVSINNLDYKKDVVLYDSNEKYYKYQSLKNNDNSDPLLIWGDSFSLEPFSHFFINNYASVIRISSNHQKFPVDIIKSTNTKTVFVVLSERNFFDTWLTGSIWEAINNLQK